MVKRRLYEILEEPPEGDRVRQVFEVFIVTLIVANIIVLMLDTVEGYHSIWHFEFLVFNTVAVLIFTVEYMLRIWVCTEGRQYHESSWGRLSYMVTPFALVDLMAILPFYLGVLPFYLPFFGVNWTFLRVLRLFRIAKIGRYSNAVQITLNVIRSRRQQLGAVLYIFVLIMVMAATMMFYAEHDAQPDVFSSIPATMWWAVITLTTVGYGDVVPITDLGKVIGGLIAVLGIFFYALPTAVLGAGFVEEMEKRRDHEKERKELREMRKKEEKRKWSRKLDKMRDRRAGKKGKGGGEGRETECPRCGHRFHD